MTTPAPETLERENDKHIPAYVDMPRLCKELCISDTTADAWVRQGILPAPRQRGGKRLWKWAEVERYLDDGDPSMQPSADPEAQRIRHATAQLSDKAADKENHQGHVRGSDPGLSNVADLRGTRSRNAAKLPGVTGDG